jgi:alkylation response protein AidB-like acyl-CoA dehydrogenase
MGLEFFPKPADDEAEIRRRTREFADEKLRPSAREDDVKARFRRDLFAEAARRRLTAILVPTRFGGGGKSSRCFYACMEELAKASPATTVTAGVTNMIQAALVQFGTPEQQERYLPAMVKGEVLAAFALSEPQSGSDAAGLRTRAERTSDGYRIDGTKVWCSSAGYADLYLLMARTGEDRTKGITSFLVPKDAPGFRVGKQEKKLGLRSSTLAELIFEDCRLPESARLGAEGQGFTVALSQLDAGRITIGAAGLGIAIEVIERAWRFLTDREAGGGERFEDASRQTLAEHFAYAQAVRTLIGQAADLKDRGERFTVLASQIKLMGSDLAVRAAHDAIQAMGFAGGLEENEVERYLRDAKALQIVEGTNQIQRLVLAREVASMMQ